MAAITSEILRPPTGGVLITATGWLSCSTTTSHKCSLVFREDRSLTVAAQIPYTLTGEAARIIPSSLSSNSNPAVRGLWLRVYQR